MRYLPPLPFGVMPYAFDLDLGLMEFEAAVATEAVEIAAAFDAGGRFVLRPRVGSRSEVDFSPDELAFLPGSVIAHNHPSGTVFSEDDAWFASEWDVAEMRAVTAQGLIYRLRRPAGGWPEPDRMRRAIEPMLGTWRQANTVRKVQGKPIIKGRDADEWTFAYQRDAFAALGVEMRRTDRWRR